MTDDDIQLRSDYEGECFVCERPIQEGEPCVTARFKVNLLVTSKTVEEGCHAQCAIMLANKIMKLARAGIKASGIEL